MRDVLEAMKQKAREEELPILRDSELPLFRGIVEHAHPEHILEIGTCIGYSTLQMASVMAEGGKITTIEVDTDRHDAARRFFDATPYRAQICALCGDGTALLDDLTGPWDFVFLDGPKGQYVRQLKKIMPHLAPGAIIMADNLRYHGMIYIEGTLLHKHRTAITRLREFLAILNDHQHFDTVFFENGDGLTVSRWKG